MKFSSSQNVVEFVIISEILYMQYCGLKENFQAQGASIRRVSSVGPQMGDELKRNGVLAAFYSLIIILIYIVLVI